MPVKIRAIGPIEPRRPQGRPKSEDLAALEQRLIGVGRQLFFRDGYGATTMSEVASAARVSKTTLYSRFPSKAALFRAIVADQIGKWDDAGIYHTPFDFETLEDTLRSYGELLLRAGTMVDFVQINRLLYSESGRFPELAEIAQARIRRGRDYLVDQIRTFAIREAVPCRDPEAAADLFLMSMIGRSSVAILGGGEFAAADRLAWLNNTLRIFLSSRSAW
jgi:AcrR family transcriptional regulator